jgi:hypothetical protein
LLAFANGATYCGEINSSTPNRFDVDSKTLFPSIRGRLAR